MGNAQSTKNQVQQKETLQVQQNEQKNEESETNKDTKQKNLTQSQLLLKSFGSQSQLLKYQDEQAKQTNKDKVEILKFNNQKKSQQQFSFFDLLCCQCNQNQVQELEVFYNQRQLEDQLNTNYQFKNYQESENEENQEESLAIQISNSNQYPHQQCLQQENSTQLESLNSQTFPSSDLINLSQSKQINNVQSIHSYNIENDQNNQEHQENISSENQDQLLNFLFSGQIEKVMKFINDKQFDINTDIQIKPQGTKLLHIACHRGFTSFVQFLLNKGALVDAQDDQGQTALMFATMENQLDSLFLLLQEGANLQIKNRKSQTAINIAEQKKLPHIVILLNKYVKKQTVRKSQILYQMFTISYY